MRPSVESDRNCTFCALRPVPSFADRATPSLSPRAKTLAHFLRALPTSGRAEGARPTPCFRADLRSFRLRGRAHRACRNKFGCAYSDRPWPGRALAIRNLPILLDRRHDQVDPDRAWRDLQFGRFEQLAPDGCGRGPVACSRRLHDGMDNDHVGFLRLIPGHAGKKTVRSSCG